MTIPLIKTKKKPESIDVTLAFKTKDSDKKPESFVFSQVEKCGA